jgi:hypothetical protein
VNEAEPRPHSVWLDLSTPLLSAGHENVGSSLPTRRHGMAIAMVQEFTVEPDDRSTENYDGVRERLNVDAEPPAGLIVHTAGFTGAGVFRIFDVWESEEAWQRFRDGRLAAALQPLMDSGSGAPPTAEYTYELHGVIKG